MHLVLIPRHLHIVAYFIRKICRLMPSNNLSVLDVTVCLLAVYK